MKRKIDIERFLQFAYRDELPKKIERSGGSWAPAFLLGTHIDASYTGEPGFPVSGPPHPDALLLDYAVRSIEDARIRWPEARDILMGELGAYLADDDPAVCRMSVQTSALVQMHARMGTRPIWDMGSVRVKRVIGRNGKPIVHGVTKGRRYGEGAYSPLELDPPAQEIACARLEWVAWRAALDELAGGTYTEFAPQRTTAPWRPWVTGEAGPRVLMAVG